MINFRRLIKLTHAHMLWSWCRSMQSLFPWSCQDCNIFFLKTQFFGCATKRRVAVEIGSGEYSFPCQCKLRPVFSPIIHSTMIIFLPDLCQIIWQSWFCLLHSNSQQEPALANTSRRGKDLMVQESHLERHPSNSPKGGFRFWMPSTNVSFATNPSGDSVALEFDYTV
jgi:hypothetical protein